MLPKHQKERLIYTLGDHGFQTGVAAVAEYLQTIVSETIGRVIGKFTDKMNNWIRFPHTDDDI